MLTPCSSRGVNKPTTRQTRHAKDFLNAKSHAREKPLLAGYQGIIISLEIDQWRLPGKAFSLGVTVCRSDWKKNRLFVGDDININRTLVLDTS